MNLDPLKKYLEEKWENLSKLEKNALSVLSDKDFYEEVDWSFLRAIPNTNIITNPSNIERNPQFIPQYNYVLNTMYTTYVSYLYDTKGKFVSFKGDINDLEKRILAANSHIDNIQKTSDLLEGAEILESYAKEFESRAKSYWDEAAESYRRLGVGFVLFAILFISFLFVKIVDISFLQWYFAEDIRISGTIMWITIKAISLIIVLQYIRFCFRNYNANKHLQQQTLHKYDVLRSLRGIYNTLDKDWDRKDRDELIKTWAIIAFQNIESGYITTKEWAGSTDSWLGWILAWVLSKK